MAVITVSRGSFSGGKVFAERLAGILEYRCVDRDVIVEKAAAYGVAQEDLRDALQKPPGLLERFSHKRFQYLALIQAALAEEVRTGRVIYHGNAGHLLLRDGANILRVRIIAPLEFRIAAVVERLRFNRAEAQAYIQKMDQDRKKWTQYLYGVDWEDPELYDLVINLESMDIEGACTVAAAAARRYRFADTPESLAALADLALASRVRASLALNGSTASLELQVAAHAGAISIKGQLSAEGQRDEIERVAAHIPGVAEVRLDELVLRTPV